MSAARMTLAEQVALEARRRPGHGKLLPAEERELQKSLRSEQSIDADHTFAAEVQRKYRWAMERALPHDRAGMDKRVVDQFIGEYGAFRKVVDALREVSPTAKRLDAAYPRKARR